MWIWLNAPQHIKYRIKPSQAGSKVENSLYGLRWNAKSIIVMPTHPIIGTWSSVERN